jgi:hypothetical protein
MMRRSLRIKPEKRLRIEVVLGAVGVAGVLEVVAALEDVAEEEEEDFRRWGLDDPGGEIWDLKGLILSQVFLIYDFEKRSRTWLAGHWRLWI